MINNKIRSAIWATALFTFSTLCPLHAVEVERVNATTIGLYEKFEAVLDLGETTFDNPYDPREIDVRATFLSPSGVEWRIFGFYDDYMNRDEWKVRFSPNEIGQWSYVVSQNSAGIQSTAEVQTFDAVASAHRGWIHVSTANPHYMEYDDGTAFYGIGGYTPWKNTVERFDNLAQYGGNMFGIWNITYGGLVNEAGLIEEELGRYNQEKCGRIDSLLDISEERGLHCMLAIWPHDLFSETVWAHQWHINPYNQIVDVVDVYSDSLCWEYQKQQYRYLIARFAHSRGFGIWEIINEINGTDAWAQGRTKEAAEWVAKVHQYFQDNDPYDHPTTASRSGGYGEYWGDVYKSFDLPNIHVYETQGWPQQYTGDPVRSSLANYAFGAARFWDNFQQPGIFGESGWDWVNFPTPSTDYSEHYHNALWATLCNGLAATPIWWTWDDPLAEQDWRQVAHLQKFVQHIDFLSQSRERFEEVDADMDLYGMKSDSALFGWVRLARQSDISNFPLAVKGDVNREIKAWAVTFYDAWSGDTLGVHIRPNADGVIYDRVPPLAAPQRDVAFRALPTDGGDTPATLQLWADAYQTLTMDSMTVGISCFLFDDQDRFCPRAENQISLTLQGAGSLSASSVKAVNGAAQVTFRPGSAAGRAVIIAESAGLAPDTLTIIVKDRELLDDFDGYGSNDLLRDVWQVKSGTFADLSLDAETKASGGYGLRVEYGIGAGYKRYAKFERLITQDYGGGAYFAFWLKPDGSDRELEIRIRDTANKYWRAFVQLSGTKARIVGIPVESFSSTASGTLDLSTMKVLTLTIRKGNGGDGDGVIWFDDFSFPASPPAAVTGREAVPQEFRLFQNYPNPFNPSTTITYVLPMASRVRLLIYNLRGEVATVLANINQDAGRHRIEWDASALPSGLYFYTLSAGNFHAMKKCLLVK